MESVLSAQWFQFALQLVVVAVTIPSVRRQLRLMAARDVINEIGNDRIRELRSWVLDTVDQPVDIATRDEIENARRLAVAYDRVGYMMKQKLVPNRALFDFQCDEIPLVWARVRPVIDDVRRTRPNYCHHFEWLATEWVTKMSRRYGRP